LSEHASRVVGAIGRIARACTAAVALTGAPLLLGCGYHLAGSELTVPGDIHSLSVGPFTNESHQEGLEKVLAFAFEREIYERGALPLRDDPSAGDGVITGTIRDFRTRPVSFDSSENALQYQAELTVDVTLRRQSDGKVLWHAKGLHAYEDYSVSRQTVVPSSSQFQQGTLDFKNLSQLSDVQLAETEKRLAIERLVHEIVHDVHDRILEDF
jgi:hypothetical protein